MIRRRMLFLVVNGDVDHGAIHHEENQDAEDENVNGWMGYNVIRTNPSVWFL